MEVGSHCITGHIVGRVNQGMPKSSLHLCSQTKYDPMTGTLAAATFCYRTSPRANSQGTP